MKDCDLEITSISAEDSLFNHSHGNKFIQAVYEAIRHIHGMTQDDIVYFTVRAAHHAVIKFEAMNIRYELKHGTAAQIQLEKHKAHINKYFLDLLKG